MPRCLSGGLIALLVALTEGEPQGWTSTFVVSLFAISALCLIAWGFAESKVQQPMVDLKMLARRPVLFTNLTALLSGFSLYATWVLLPSFFQFPSSLPPAVQHLATYGFGTTVLVAGLWILPCSAAIVVAGPIGGILGRRVGPRIPLAVGMLLFAIGAAAIALWHSTALAVSMEFMVCGIGIGFAFAAMPRLIVGAVAPSETGVATGMNNVIRTIGGVIGAQIAAVLLGGQRQPRHVDTDRRRLRHVVLDQRRGRPARRIDRPARLRRRTPLAPGDDDHARSGRRRRGRHRSGLAASPRIGTGRVPRLTLPHSPEWSGAPPHPGPLVTSRHRGGCPEAAG